MKIFNKGTYSKLSKMLPNTILNFHAIYDNGWMDSTFEFLKRNYNIVSLTDIENYYYSDRELKNACHITFDDGDISFYTKVFPLLKKHNISASIYVSPLMAMERRNFWFQEMHGYDKTKMLSIIRDSDLLSQLPEQEHTLLSILKSMTLNDIWTVIQAYRDETGTPPKPCMNMCKEQLIELHDSDLVSIGAHTMNHPILRNESNETAAYEIKASIDGLSNMLNDKVKYFSYPNGIPNLDFTGREMDLLKQSGIKISFSTENKPFSRNDNFLSIPRNGLTYGSRYFILMKLFTGSRWDLVKRLIKGKQDKDYRIEGKEQEHQEYGGREFVSYRVS